MEHRNHQTATDSSRPSVGRSENQTGRREIHALGREVPFPATARSVTAGRLRPRVRGLWWGLLLLALPCAVVPAHAQARHLNLFIWSEYIDPSIVADFEKRFDCKVTIDVYEEEESMMSKLLGGGDALYDVIVPSNQLVPALIKLKLLTPLPRASLPNLRNLEPQFANARYDPGNRYTIPFQWGTLGIYLRNPKHRVIEES
ncbi:MAG: hypothetical protein KGS61_05800, partial [Verrucomicrobia bacterium]|nr:hypothetical protein [Verrucomicrobiota bacterium]